MTRIAPIVVAALVLMTALTPGFASAQGPDESQEERSGNMPEFVGDILGSVGCMLGDLVGWVPVVGDAFGGSSC